MRSNRWTTLALLALAQFMVVLDVTIVNVALPHIQVALRFSAHSLQWVVSAYTLLFGGFLLLGGRAADLLGRRAVFLGGLTLFTGASLAAGLSSSSEMLIAARAVQGLGGALMSPAALSLLTVTFAHGRDRNIALGIWGALAGLGGTLGVVAGGLLVDSAGWAWVFFVNVPIGAVLIALARLVIAESRAETDARRSFDLAGALLGTGGLLGVVFAITRTQAVGWGSGQVLAPLAGGLAALLAFAAVESRASAPLIAPRLMRARGLPTSSLALALNGAAFLGMFFLTAIFLQQVQGRSALATGVQLLPMGVAAVLAAVIASNLVTRIGTRPVQAGGAVLSVAGLLLLSGVGVHTGYVTGLLPGFVTFGAGIIGVGVAGQVSAIAEVGSRDAGAASGLVNAAYQVGGALGLAIITTLANSRVTHALASGVAPHQALADGFTRGLLIAAALAAVNLLLSLASPSARPSAEQLTVAAAAG